MIRCNKMERREKYLETLLNCSIHIHVYFFTFDGIMRW